jgi:hypothetical protein
MAQEPCAPSLQGAQRFAPSLSGKGAQLNGRPLPTQSQEEGTGEHGQKVSYFYSKKPLNTAHMSSIITVRDYSEDVYTTLAYLQSNTRR